MTGGSAPRWAAVLGLADVVVLTSDNPRSEDPMTIIAEIRAGLAPGADVVVEPDRSEAIRVAIGRAEPGDLVLLAGKGHETTQTADGRSWPFDDRTEAHRALEGRFGGTPA